MPRPLYILAALGLSLTREPLLAQRPMPALRTTHPEGTIVRKIPLTGHPYGVAIDTQGEVYVSRVHSNQLLRVGFAPGADGEVTQIGHQPPHVVIDADGRTAFATLQGGRAVVRIDTRTGATIDSVPLGSDGFNLALDPDGVHLVATAAAGWAYRITCVPLRVVDSVYVGVAPNGIAFDPRGGEVYVSSRDSGTVTAIDARTFRPTRVWHPGGALQRIAVAANGDALFVADERDSGSVVRIDTRSGAVHRLPMSGNPYGVGVSPDGRRLWVLLRERGMIMVLDLPSLRLRDSIDVGGRPRNLVFTRRGDRAAITTESALVLLR